MLENIEKLDLEECFSTTYTPKASERIFADDPAINDRNLFDPITYRCRDCKAEIQFEDRDFQRHEGSTFSNLKKEDDKLISDYVTKHPFDYRSFLDFYCPSCQRPTRIFFFHGVGGKHGEYLVSISAALAIRK